MGLCQINRSPPQYAAAGGAAEDCFSQRVYMGKLMVSQEGGAGFTLVSNEFIDYFMPFCNELQLKVYLHVLKAAQGGQGTGIAEIADLCNDSEREIRRALQYWERLNVMTLEYSADSEPVSIRLNPLKKEEGTAGIKNNILALPEVTVPKEADAVISVSPAEKTPAPVKKETGFARREYGPEDFARFEKDQGFSKLVPIAEIYHGRPIKQREAETLLFLYDVCALPVDLIDFLMQQCIALGKKSFHYYEQVGIDWANHGIKTRDEALAYSGGYDKISLDIMKALGKNDMPLQIEAEFITRWRKEWGFSIEVILEACKKSVLATDSHRFEYADKILKSWNDQAVKDLSDVQSLEKKWHEKKATRLKGRESTNRFNQFPQRRYEKGELEQFISNH